MSMARQSDTDVTGQYYKGDRVFLSGLKEAELTEATPKATWAIYLMLLAVVSALVWSGVARVDEVTKAEGRVVPDGKEQVIASLEGGILRSLAVREGALVEKGQELLQLDPTRVEAQQNEGAAKRIALLAQQARLEAESTGRSLRFPPDVLVAPDVIEGETEVFNTRRRALEEGVGVTRGSLGLLNRELAMSERMSAAKSSGEPPPSSVPTASSRLRASAFCMMRHGYGACLGTPAGRQFASGSSFDWRSAVIFAAHGCSGNVSPGFSAAPISFTNLRSGSHRPLKSGLPSDVLGAGPVRSGFAALFCAKSPAVDRINAAESVRYRVLTEPVPLELVAAGRMARVLR